MSTTLYDKIWNDHLVDQQDDGTALLFVDRHLVHEVTSPQAFEGLRNTNRKVRRAKLYYLRDRTGKSARIAEKIRKKIGIDVDVKPETVTEENVAPAVEAAPTAEAPKEEAPAAEATKEEQQSESTSEKK